MNLSDLLVWNWLILKYNWGVAVKKIIIILGSLFLMNAKAEIKPYQSIENTGLNKQERIEVIDKYLVDLAVSLKNMDSKLEENSKKLKSLEEVIKTIKDADQKKADALLGEKKTTLPLASKDLNEVEKLKSDILTLKNQDIEKMKIDFSELKDTVEALQASFKTMIK